MRPRAPLLLWVHYVDPHGPYRPPADAPRAFSHPGSVPLEKERVHPCQREPGTRGAHDYVDRYDEEIVRVPLLPRGPGIAPGRRAHPVSLVDLVPTLLRRIGADVPPDLDGRDLLAPGAPAQRSVFAEANGVDERWRAVVRGREKWVARVLPGEREPSGVRDYDLAADPGERAPAPWPSGPGEAPRALLELIRGDPLAGGAPARARTRIDPRADPDDLEALRALGYAE